MLIQTIFLRISQSAFVGSLLFMMPAFADIDCNDTELWPGECALKAFRLCTDANQREITCLPNISDIELTLDLLHEDLVSMNPDKHSWAGGTGARPGDSIIGEQNKRHVQSIQYWENSEGERHIITSISDEHETNHAAVQLIKTGNFGDTGGTTDNIASQVVLISSDNEDYDFTRFNHPGGGQLIGDFLFLALEDFKTEVSLGNSTGEIGPPATGVFFIHDDQVWPYYLIDTTNRPPVPASDPPAFDHHQSTAAITKLEDDHYLLATCVGPHGCNDINFYKSKGTDLALAGDEGFKFIDSWKLPGGWNKNDWSECAPQNMAFVPENDGDIYLVMFGAVNRGIQSGLLSGCSTGVGYDDHLYAYKLSLVPGADPETTEVALTLTNKVDVIPKSHICKPLLVLEAKELHGLNFLAGSGFWLSPDGKDDISILATEHYDTCDANKRPVNAKTRWGVSSNWNQLQYLSIDHSTVTVNEGNFALNSGHYWDFPEPVIEVSAGSLYYPDDQGSPGPFISGWSWSLFAADGPDDSQSVDIEWSGFSGLAKVEKKFELVVNNVPPTAVAGPDQVVECSVGRQVSLDATASSDPGLDELSFQWAFTSVPGPTTPPFDNPKSATPVFVPVELGAYNAAVTVSDDDGASNSDDLVIMYEDTTPPTISDLEATPDILWPPNNKMVQVGISVSVDDQCDSAPICVIQTITSNEAESEAGDFDAPADLTAILRAQRMGSGTDRVYTVTVECTDFAGNSTTGTTIVTVPHDLGKEK